MITHLNSNEKTKKAVVLFAIIAMTFMATLDSSIVNVALPVLSDKLKVSLSSIEWVVASYSIIICSSILFFGRLGDILGKSRIFQIGTFLFTLSSLLCGLSQSFVLLIIFRFLQGIGASAYMANNHGIITELFPKESRGKALGILVTAVAIGNMAGPSVGGLILSIFHWNFIFFINVPFGIIVFILGLGFLPKSNVKLEKIDFSGSVLQFWATLLFFGALIASQQLGISNPYIIGTIMISFVLAVLFIMIEKKQVQPLLDLGIFMNVRFSINLCCALTSFVCISASSILIPFYLQDALKISPFYAGLIMMVSPFILAICSPIFGSVSDRMESEKIILIGLLTLSLGLFLMSRLSEHSLIVLFVVFISIMAIGQALFQPANNALIMSTCPKDKLGIVGSVNSLVRNLGQVIGITLSTTLLYCFMSNAAGHKIDDYVYGHDEIFVYGMRNVYMILAVICLIGATMIGTRLYGKKRYCKKAHNIEN